MVELGVNVEIKTTQVIRFDRSLGDMQLFLIQAFHSHLESALQRRLYIGGADGETHYDDFVVADRRWVRHRLIFTREEETPLVRQRA